MDGDKNQQAMGVEGTSSHVKHKKTKKVHKHKLILIVFVGIFVLVGGYFAAIYGLTVTGDCGGKADSPLYTQAASQLGSDKVNELEKTVATIQKTRGWDKDVNCLYPVAVYYLNKEDVPNATLYIGKIDKVYNPNEGVANPYRAKYRNLQSLKAQLEFVEKLHQADKKNQVFF